MCRHQVMVHRPDCHLKMAFHFIPEKYIALYDVDDRVPVPSRLHGFSAHKTHRIGNCVNF